MTSAGSRHAAPLVVLTSVLQAFWDITPLLLHPGMVIGEKWYANNLSLSHVDLP